MIIPTYNRQQLLVEAIENVLAQDHQAIEVIVIDDGSVDDTARVVGQFDQRVKYHYQENQGQSSARNKAIAMAQGEIIALLDSDDVWLPGKISKELALFNRYPDVGMIAGNGEYYLENQLRSSSVLEDGGIVFTDNQPRHFCWSFPYMTYGSACLTSAMTIKSTTLARLGDPVFDVNLRFDEDWDLEFRLFCDHKVLFYPDIVVKQRAFADDTRVNYNVPGQTRSAEQQVWFCQSKLKILERYVGKINWGEQAQLRFSQRCEELREELRELTAVS